MANVVIGNNPLTLPLVFKPALIEMQSTWGDGWEAAPQFELEELVVNASSVDPSTATLTYRYGENVKQVTDTGFNSYAPVDLSGTWVRISMFDDSGNPQVQFVGQIDSQARELWGSSTNPAGKQFYTAVDPLRTLQKIMVSTAIFYDSEDADGSTDPSYYDTVGWVPPMNKRDKRGLIVGNVSDPDDDGDYYYGGTSPATDSSPKWTRTQYANYLIDNFVQQTDDTGDDTGPEWFLVGQTDVTDGMNDTIDLPQSASVAELLKRIIDPKYGIDFNVVYSPADNAGNGEGFSVNIFALTAQTATFGTATMPTNPNTVSIDRTNQIDLIESYLVESDAKKVDMVKVLGKRIIVCGTLWGTNAQDGTSQSTPPDLGSLVKRWSGALEADYISAGGSGDPSTCDPIRRREKYRDVYQHLGAPDDWDLNGGAWAVATKFDGTLQPVGQSDYQTLVRETLPWIPLKQGYDYTIAPPFDNTDGEVEPEVSAPLAWVYDAQSLILGNPGYIQCELNGIGVGVPHNDWGIFLHASPNHRLALNAWDPEQEGTTGESNSCDFDYTQTVATIAIESDHRLAIAYQVPSSLAAGDGSVMTIEDNEAELWVALPGTIVDVDESGNLDPIASPVDADDGSLIVLRNDVDRLSLLMAGIISRYINARARARIVINGFQPWGYMVGSILTVFQQGDDVTQVGAVITSIRFTCPESVGMGGEKVRIPQTILSSGYA